MKLVMAIIHDEDALDIMDSLSDAGFSITKLATTGGFLRVGNTTLICGCEAARVQEFADIVEKKCRSRTQVTAGHAEPVEVTVGGATIFVLGVEEFKKV